MPLMKEVEEIDRDEYIKRIELATAELDRQFGAGSVMRIGSSDIEPWPAVSTGALSLDIALGIGGLPRGRIVEIFGHESSGKSTLCLSAIANAQRQGLICGFIDAEHALDPQYAHDIGVNVDDLFISQPDHGEMAIDVLIKLVRTGAFGVIVVDSVAALTPKAELDGDVGDNQMGLLPRMMSKSMRMLAADVSKTKTLVIFTNQIREKIGVFFGNPETTPGGRALRFQASVRVKLRRKEDIKDRSGDIKGLKVVADIPKNKMAPPLKRTEFDILYGRGVNELGCLVDTAVDFGIFEKAGSWIKYEGESFAQGREGAMIKLGEDMVFTNELKERVLSAWRS